MQITALIQVINYLKDKSGDPLLLEGYQRLANVIREASKKPEADFMAAIIKEKESLQKYLWESDPVEWGYASYCLFEKINNNHLFGKTAADWLEKNISSTVKDYRSLESDLTKKIKLITKLSDSLGKFMQLFDQVIPAEIFLSENGNDNKSTMTLYFEGSLKVNNITDLERYARLWDGILGAFSRLTSEESLSLDISSFQNGNIILGVATQEKILNAMMEGVSGTLASLPVLLKIRKIQYELTQIPLNNNLIDLLEAETRDLINQAAFVAAERITFKYQNENTDTEGAIRDMSRVLKQIQSFIDKGGKIEFNPLQPTSETSQLNKTLNESFVIARELESLSAALAMTLEEKNKSEVVTG